MKRFLFVSFVFASADCQWVTPIDETPGALLPVRNLQISNPQTGNQLDLT